MRTITINAEGKTDNDLELAVEEALRIIKSGCTSGMNSNDTGSYDFQISGDEELSLSDDEMQDLLNGWLEDNKHGENEPIRVKEVTPFIDAMRKRDIDDDNLALLLKFALDKAIAGERKKWRDTKRKSKKAKV